MILYSQINQIATDAVMHRHKLTDQAAKDTNANTRHLDLRTDISQFKVSKHFFLSVRGLLCATLVQGYLHPRDKDRFEGYAEKRKRRM